MRNKSLLLILALIGAIVANDALAQNRGRGRNRGGFGRGGFGGPGKAAMLSIEAVAKDIGLTEAQVKKVADLREELSNNRGERGPRLNFRDMSDEERQEAMRKRREERTARQAKENEALKTVLDSSQLKRLDEIALQVRGVSALLDPAIQKSLGMSEEAVKSLAEAAREAGAARGAKMRELFQDRQSGTFQEDMQKVQQEYEDKVLAMLSAEEVAKFKGLQGKKIEISQQDLFRAAGFGRRGNRGNRGGGRPNRESRPELE